MNVTWTSSDIREALVCVIVGYSLVGPLIVLNARPVRRVLVMLALALDPLPLTMLYLPYPSFSGHTLPCSHSHSPTHPHLNTALPTPTHHHLYIDIFTLTVFPSLSPISTASYFPIFPPPSLSPHHLPPPAEPHSFQCAVFGLIFPAVNRTTFGLYGSLWPIFNRKSPN